MGLKVITEPATEPITLTEAKLWIRYTQSLQNDVVTALITAARRYVESWTNRTLVTTTYEYYVEDFARCSPQEIQIPKSTINS